MNFCWQIFEQRRSTESQHQQDNIVKGNLIKVFEKKLKFH